MAFLAVIFQLISVKAPLGDDDLPRRVLFVASYLLLLAFITRNVRRPGIAIIGIGLICNFLAIAANEGLMAITPETILKTGGLPRDAMLGHWLPDSKDVLLQRDHVRLWFLTDRLVWQPVSSVVRAFSIGDLIVLGGLAVTVLDICLPRVSRETPDGAAPPSA